MLYCFSDIESPARYLSCGKLVNRDGFTHERRNMDCFVFIIVCEGTLHIEQHGQKFDVKENEFILLFPGQTHFGYKPSTGKLSYYWVHFTMQTTDYKIYSKHHLFFKRSDRGTDTLADSLGTCKNLQDVSENLPDTLGNSPGIQTFSFVPHNCLLLPEYGCLSSEKRSVLLFVQLLDMAKRDNYQATLRCKYALNLLLLEFTQEAFTAGNPTEDKTPRPVRDLMEWIRTHYDEPLTVSSLAEQYNYNPTYLSALFKKYTGFPVSGYVNHVRIASAKNILCSTDTISIQEAAYLCGFTDEKYFMRLFKKLEGVTPSQYRNAFFEKRVNKK